MLVFDLEADGFLEDVTKVHCLTLIDTETGDVARFNEQGGPDTIAYGLKALGYVPKIAGHNVLGYDLPVLKKLYGFEYTGEVVDTLIIARVLYPETGDSDDKLIAKGKFPTKYRGAHSLEAWGFRLGVMKDEYTGDPTIADPKERFERRWESWNQTMEDYCVQDVRATAALLKHLQQRDWPTQALPIEHATKRITMRQEANGICFDVKAAWELHRVLSVEKLGLEDKLKAEFGFWFAKDGPHEFTPKRDDPKRGYVAGVPLTKIKAVYFNPGSRRHIERILTRQFGWKPTQFTAEGYAEVSEESLKAIKHPEAATLIRYLMVSKRLGQLSEGKQAWLKHVRPDGRIHGSVNTLGAVTARMSHSHPNLAQVPNADSEYGPECRALFGPRPGWKQVGIDAAALELRILAGYMAAYDGGAYVKVVVDGKKADGTEIHSVNQRALEIDSRNDAKTWFYAWLYGGGDEKLGMILSKVRNKRKNTLLGRAKRTAFETNLPAMGKLVQRIKAKARAQKWLRAVDQRYVYVRSDHAAPNTLFQSAGAIIMKHALVLFDTWLQNTAGLTPGKDYEFIANVHDEWQLECRPEVAETVGRLGVESIREAGRKLLPGCPLDGEFKVGNNWAECH